MMLNLNTVLTSSYNIPVHHQTDSMGLAEAGIETKQSQFFAF